MKFGRMLKYDLRYGTVRRFGESVYYAHDMYDAALDADALILYTLPVFVKNIR